MSEKEKQFYKELPTGTGRESEPKETLPAIEVDNEVIWVNPAFSEMPFKLEEGASTELGLFLTPKPKKKDKAFYLKAMPLHGRSALLGRAIFKDNDGRFYRDIDLKGIGKVEFKKSKPKVGRVERRESGGTEGISSYLGIEKSAKMAEEFLELGIRTERYLALIELKEIINRKGKKISIEEAQKEKLISPFQVGATIGIRAFGTKHRISDMNDATLVDVKTLVAQEIGEKKEDFSWHDYLKWFSKTLGENIGLMHKNYFSHGYLLNHNVTLDCRIIDLDSVMRSGRKMKSDWYKTSHGALRKLFKKVSPKDKSCEDFGNYLDYFNETYIKALGYTPEFLSDKNI